MITLINEALRANILSRLIHTPQLKVKHVALTATEAVEALNGWVYKQPGMATIDDCKNTLNSVAEHFGYDETSILLQRFGVNKLTELWIGMYESLVSFGDATVEYGVPPSSSWQNDNTPTYPPRWLVWHDTSEALFEVFNYAEYIGCMSEGNCSDVTGVEKFELEFKSENEL